ncbi:glutathione s-transferase [Nesidiocoris tenuis]|uniref:Glutathione s-transferase n=1 Tax=Nesidiocoris tenuis TaxID=355587 RepID=A0ABN7B2X2_9HEMI|nr:glutathione s-transferase [Nesidiocoris tenuis]
MPGKTIHLSAGSQDVPVQDGKIRLYSMRFCPYAHRIHLVLTAKNIPHDIVYIDLKNKPEWYLKKYPAGKVPSIVVDGDFLAESLIIADFLDEYDSDGKQLHAEDPLRKAKDRMLIESFGKVITNLYKCFTSKTLDLSLLEPIFNDMDPFEKELGARGTKFFAGEAPGMVDYMIWPWFERLDMIRAKGGEAYSQNENSIVPIDRFPKLLAWCHTMLEDAVVKQWLMKTFHFGGIYGSIHPSYALLQYVRYIL